MPKTSPNSPVSDELRERMAAMSRRANERRVILGGREAELLREHLRTCPAADPARSAAWARLWAKLLAPAERAASADSEEGTAA